MSFSRYPEYKDSGVEWLGEVPADWSVARLGFESQTLVPMRDKPENLSGEIPWVRIEDFSGKYIGASKTGQGVSPETVRKMSLKVLPVGSVLCSCSCSMGATAIVSAPLVTNQTFIGIVPGLGYISTFLYYTFLASAKYLDSIGKGAIQTYLSRDDFRQLRLPKPSIGEQESISIFLDSEVAKIDSLIGEQEKLIALLKEKRQAVISHAVTKGLDPNVPMKDSGIEWLGEVPAHWDVVSVRRIAKTVQTGSTPSDYALEESDGELYWYTPGDFGAELDLGASSRRLDSACLNSGSVRVFPAGSVLIVSIGATLGKVGLTLTQCSANQQINAVVPKEHVSGRFLAYSLSIKDEVMKYLSNASTIGIMNQEKTKDIPFVIPPLEEQRMICDWLERRLAELVVLLSESEAAIALLAERRSSLISAAVTGKIDVRQYKVMEVA